MKNRDETHSELKKYPVKTTGSTFYIGDVDVTSVHEQIHFSGKAKMIRRRLQALQYPEPEGFAFDFAHMRVLVGWLENQKIREYPPEERAPLCSPASQAEWQPALWQVNKGLSIGS